MNQPILCPACREPNSPRARFCIHCGHDVILNNSGPRYYLTRVVKAGGQGAIYEAVGEDGAVYAVKEMLDTFTDPLERAAAVARFNAEAATLRQLAHPRIPRVYASFNDEGRHYLVMEFIRGEDLDELVAREGAQPEARVLAWADELCDVLSFLHDQDVIYRDMKPANIMLEQPAGTLKLIDFGIAKLFQPTQRGTQIGTPGYAPPEQYQGLATKLSDIYALGATLHHLLSGRDPQQHPPFSFPPLRDLRPEISPSTEAAVARALQMRQEDRFQSVEELRAALLPQATVRRSPAVASPQPTQAAPGLTPASPQPATASQPRASGPSSVAGHPAAPQASQVPTVVIPAPQAPQRPRRRRGIVLLTALVMLLSAVGYSLFFFLTLGAPNEPQATPSDSVQVLVARTFEARDIEIVVPVGAGENAVHQAFAAAFLELTRLECSCEPQIQPGTLVYLFEAAPRQISVGTDGARFRASLQATILVPQP